MPVVGTAGHVDHGKSTLVQALTGRDPDRWDEEKERGLTIDLGFAWTTLEDGSEISFVDVPGHEKFIKNMLAGTDGFNVALFVVAADEGWMPQSEEHLAVLDLLGIDHGVVALTKVDRVDEDLAELAALEVEERLAGTSLEGSPIIPVSAVAGTGIDAVRAALADAVAGAPPHLTGRPRLWVDRSFTITGAGTVVTGTLTGSTIAAGDQVEIHPGPLAGRVRSLQSHESERSEAVPGSRVTVNVAGLERTDLARGAMVGAPGDWLPSNRILVSIRNARYVEEPLTDRGAYHLHLGSGAWPVRLRVVGALPTGDTAAIVTTDDAIPVEVGDRFVIREVGRRSIVAGGRVLEPIAPRKGSTALDVASDMIEAVDGEPDQRATALLRARGVATVTELSAHAGGGESSDGVRAGYVLIVEGRAAELESEASAMVEAFHTDNPLRPGMPKASLASRLGITPDALGAVLARQTFLEDRGSVVAAAGFTASLGQDGETEWERVRGELTEAGLTVPRVGDLGLETEMLHALLREERLVRVSNEFVYLPEQIDELISRLSELPERFTVAEFRDTLGLTRKYAVPLVEWLDGQRITVRHGDERSLVG